MREDKRLNEIIRIKKHTNNFVIMDKTFLADERLSFKAKGILAYLLSKPDDWKVIVGDLVKQSKDGKTAVYAGLKELREYGYYTKVPVRNEDGTRIVRWESVVYEVPCDVKEQETEDTEETSCDDLAAESMKSNVQQETVTQENEKTKSNTTSDQERTKKVSRFIGKTKKAKTISNSVQKVQQNEETSAPSLLPSFQEVENQDIGNQFIENWERNKNYTNNINNTNNDSNLVKSSQTKTDGQSVFEQTLSVIHDNIAYEDLKEACSEKDMKLVDDFVTIMADALLSKSDTVRVGKEEKPRELVKSSLMKLDFFDIQDVLCRFKSYGEKIIKKQAFILSMLYRQPIEKNIWLTNQLYVDFGYM